jgi:hypothetical protein
VTSTGDAPFKLLNLCVHDDFNALAANGLPKAEHEEKILGASWGVPADILGYSWVLLPPSALQDHSSITSLP